MSKNRLFLKILCILTVLPQWACGVRGDPVPPGYPTELGRGRPTFKDPQKRQTYPQLPSAEQIDNQLIEEEKEDEDEQ